MTPLTILCLALATVVVNGNLNDEAIEFAHFISSAPAQELDQMVTRFSLMDDKPMATACSALVKPVCGSFISKGSYLTMRQATLNACLVLGKMCSSVEITPLGGL